MLSSNIKVLFYTRNYTYEYNMYIVKKVYPLRKCTWSLKYNKFENT